MRVNRSQPSTGSPPDRDHRHRLEGLWDRPDVRWLLGSQAISGFGDWAATVALMVLTLQLTGSSTAVGGLLVIRLAPAVVAAPLVSRVGTRWSRRRVMVAVDASRAAVVFVIPFVGTLWWVYGWAFLLELAGLLYLPARDSSVPDLVRDDRIPMANSLLLAASYATIPLGAAGFAATSWLARGLSSSPTTIALWFDAASFVVSLVMLLRIRTASLRRPLAREADGEGGIHAGFRDALRIPLVRAVAPSTVMVAVGLGALFSLGIVFVREVLDATDAEFALLIALFGVGAGFGMLVAGRFEHPTLAQTRLAVVGQGVVVGGMSFAPTIGLALVGAVLFGAATATTLAMAMSVVQESLDARDRELAFSAFHILIRVGLAASAVLAGFVADRLRSIDWPVVGEVAPARIVLAASGVLVVVVAAASGGTTEARESPPAAARER